MSAAWPNASGLACSSPSSSPCAHTGAVAPRASTTPKAPPRTEAALRTCVVVLLRCRLLTIGSLLGDVAAQHGCQSTRQQRPSRGTQVVEEHDAPGIVGEGELPVRVLPVGARLVDGS